MSILALNPDRLKLISFQSCSNYVVFPVFHFGIKLNFNSYSKLLRPSWSWPYGS